MTTIHEFFRAAFVGMLLVFLASLAHVQAQEVESAGPALTVTDPGDDGRVFCNGVRRQDEIVVVNTRMLGCSCDPESIRTEQRIAAGEYKVNGFDMNPPSKTKENGKKLVEYRANLTVDAIRKAIAKRGSNKQ